MCKAQDNVYYFQFRYHGPDAWELVQAGDECDLDSTGIFPISAFTEPDA